MPVYMTPQAKQKVDITWRVVATALLSVLLYFAIKIDNKIDYSYEANVKQQIINENNKSVLIELRNSYEKLDLSVIKIADRQYLLESKVYRRFD